MRRPSNEQLKRVLLKTFNESLQKIVLSQSYVQHSRRKKFAVHESKV